MSDQTAQTIRRRRVFYIPGYDPIHPRRYRELYRKEGADQAAISGYEIVLKPMKRQGSYGWQVAAEIAGQSVHAEFEVLVWSDIVRQSMSNSIPATYSQLVRTAWEYISTGALWRLMRLRKGPVLAALYPVGALILLGGLALLIWWATAKVAGVLLGTSLIAQGLGLALGVLPAWALLDWIKRKDRQFFVFYLMHDYAYSARWKGRNPPELEARMAEFQNRIAEALGEDWDEVLVVGHSSGAHLAVSVLADLIRAGRMPSFGPQLAFLSLGQVVPMVNFLRDAWRLRAELAFLSATDALTWIDVTAPGDGCAFALCDPVGVSGVAPANKRWPLVVSAAFMQTLSAEKWKALRWRFFRLHFQ